MYEFCKTIHSKIYLAKSILLNFVNLSPTFCRSLQACILIKKEALAQVFSCKLCEIFRNSILTEHLWTTASADSSLLSK